VTSPTHTVGDDLSRAEVLHWQGTFRMGIAAAIAGGALLLRTLGVVSADWYAAYRMGTQVAAFLFAMLTALYIALTGYIQHRAKRERKASRFVVRTQLAADTLVVHGCALLLTPPD